MPAHTNQSPCAPFSWPSHIITADNNGSLHLVGDDNSTEKLSTDAHVACPWALLVDVDTVLGLKRSLEAKTNALDEAERGGYVSTKSCARLPTTDNRSTLLLRQQANGMLK
eukprot:767491-Hanusia_phi.AAC.4